MSHNLVMTGAAYAAGLYSQALSAGNGTAVVLPSATQFTVEIAVKISSTAGTLVAVGQANAFWMGRVGTNAECHYGSSATEVTLASSVNIADGNWHRLKLSLDPVLGGVFLVDGAVVATSAVTPAVAGVIISGGSAPVAGLGWRTFSGVPGFDWDGSIDEGAVYSNAQPAAYVPGPVSNGAANLVALYHFDGNGNDSASGTLIPVDAANLYWSPYNWDTLEIGELGASAKSMQTTACGAYLKTQITGTTQISLAIDASTLSGFGASAPILRWSIGNGPLQSAQMTPGVGSLSLASGLTSGTVYSVQVWVLGADESAGTRWGSSGAGPTNVVRLQGLLADTGATLSAPSTLSALCAFFGDSIVEGVRAAGTTTEPADHARSAAWFVGTGLDAEIGVIGYGGIGWQATGSGSMPAFPDMWDGYSFDRPRDFSTPPDFVFTMLGFNGSTSASDIENWLTDARALLGASAWIFVLGAPSGVATAAQSTGVADYQAGAPSDDKVAFLDFSDRVPTTGLSGFTGATQQSVDGVHPYEIENAFIASSIVALAQEAMGSGGSASSFGTFGGGRL